MPAIGDRGAFIHRLYGTGRRRARNAGADPLRPTAINKTAQPHLHVRNRKQAIITRSEIRAACWPRQAGDRQESAATTPSAKWDDASLASSSSLAE
jgi:hypothetical protein